MAKGSANVSCVLGRESANVIGLEGVAKGIADVPAFSEKSRLISSGWMEWPKAAPMYPAYPEESRLISSGWKEWPKAAPMYPAFSEESANVIGLVGAAKVIPNEPDVRYDKMERVDHLGTDRVGVCGAEQESGKILAEPATYVAR